MPTAHNTWYVCQYDTYMSTAHDEDISTIECS